MISGELMIAGRRAQGSSGGFFTAPNPATGQALPTQFASAGAAEVAEACAAAQAAFGVLSAAPPSTRAALLDRIATELELLGEAIITQAGLESALPAARLTGELARTTGQLRQFADLVRGGRWADVRIDPAQATPAPRPDLRLGKVGLGPVAVFGASNFPLAFSVAGGDTASALAAGCPVVVKGHPAHPGTGELVGQAIARAVAGVGLPAGVFSLLNGPGLELGQQLVGDPRIKAVGFTGSRSGGLALLALAQQRAEPIPVYAEMSSINPVYLLPARLARDAVGLAQGFVASLTMGVGQFCTNPGLLIAIDGPGLATFLETAATSIATAGAGTMLTAGISHAYRDGMQRLARSAQVIGRGADATTAGAAQPMVATVTAAAFMADATLAAEIFGPAGLVVTCRDADELLAVTDRLEGQLTATLQLDDADFPLAERILPLLQARVGRIIANGWPTGVAVAPAMVHGGPYPATSDSRTSSVGTLAIDRFLRPVSYQSMPQALLPAALRDDNPFGLPRLIDGVPE